MSRATKATTPTTTPPTKTRLSDCVTQDYEGYRVHRYTDGSVYSGEWVGGRKKGLGVMQLADDSVYEGEFSGDLFCGLGRIFYENGSGFIGQFDRGVRHGYGQYTDVVKGEVYTGEWFQDKRGGSSILNRRAARGTGTHQWDDKSRYRGEWENGVQHGNGVYRYVNGDRYIGQWRKGLQHGFGIVAPRDGRRRTELYEFSDGEPIAVFDEDKHAKRQYNATNSAALIAAGQAKTLQWASGYLLQRAELLADSAVALMEEQQPQRESTAASSSPSSSQQKQQEATDGGRGGRDDCSESYWTRAMSPNMMSPQEALQPIAECPSWRERGRSRSNSSIREAPVPPAASSPSHDTPDVQSPQRAPPASPYSTTKLLRPSDTTRSDAAVEVKQKRSMLASLRSALSRATRSSTHQLAS